jgi:hypothetical protein
MVMIRSLQRDENDRGLEVGDKPAMTPFWKLEIIHYGKHHYCHHHYNRHHAGGAHEIQSSNETSAVSPSRGARIK